MALGEELPHLPEGHPQHRRGVAVFHQGQLDDVLALPARVRVSLVGRDIQGHRGQEAVPVDAPQGRVRVQVLGDAPPVLRQVEIGIFAGEDGGEQIDDVHLQAERIRLSEDGAHPGVHRLPAEPDHRGGVGGDSAQHPVVERREHRAIFLARHGEEVRGAGFRKKRRHRDAARAARGLGCVQRLVEDGAEMGSDLA